MASSLFIHSARQDLWKTPTIAVELDIHVAMKQISCMRKTKLKLVLPF